MYRKSSIWKTLSGGSLFSIRLNLCYASKRAYTLTSGIYGSRGWIVGYLFTVPEARGWWWLATPCRLGRDVQRQPVAMFALTGIRTRPSGRVKWNELASKICLNCSSRTQPGHHLSGGQPVPSSGQLVQAWLRKARCSSIFKAKRRRPRWSGSFLVFSMI